ncbi:AraC family transcriptional regulator [Methylosinus sp. R-45379]|uniref:helix-turn-helix domain-containing protein n=1 Tax=Methylosinus sp. R-45379 TaxID=980563 RepID=UPI000A516F15|nr:AraC family transcriptional regulator [Methylosinus sp. R-45379]
MTYQPLFSSGDSILCVRTNGDLRTDTNNYILWYSCTLSEFTNIYRCESRRRDGPDDTIWFVCLEISDECWIIKGSCFSDCGSIRATLGVRPTIDPKCFAVRISVDRTMLFAEHDLIRVACDKNDAAFILKYFTKLMFERQNSLRYMHNEYSRDVSDVIIARAVASLIRSIGGDIDDKIEANQFVGVKKERVQAILAEIRSNFRKHDFSVKLVADKFKFTNRYIHALLEETGTSFTERVTRLRINEAYEKLTSGDINLRIGQIAFEVGFSDQPHFNRAFKARFGLSPGEARNRMRIEQRRSSF